jgi:thymidylate kinase
MPSRAFASPLIVEFVGLPGAGKTTVSKTLASSLQIDSKRVLILEDIEKSCGWGKGKRGKNRIQKVIGLASATVRHWNASLESVLYASQVKPLNAESFICLTTVPRLLEMVQKTVSSKSCDVVLLDQWLIQNIWSVGVTGEITPTNFLERLIRKYGYFDIPVLVVHFDLDVNTAVNRIQCRSTTESRFDKMQAEKAHAILLKHCSSLTEIIRYIEDVGIPVLKVDAAQTAQKNSQLILSWISSMLGQGRITVGDSGFPGRTPTQMEKES